MKVRIIGAGLAGCAAAWILKRSGVDVVLCEVGDAVAGGASGNVLGMYNPRFGAFETPESLFYMTAFEQAIEVFEGLQDIGWNPCGALHLITDEKKEKRFRQTVENWRWSEDELRIVDAAEASEIAGVVVGHEALYLPRSGSVSPKKLCMALVEGVDVRFGERVENLDALDADVVIVANGMGAKAFLDLPLKGVRGQVTEVTASEASKDLQVNLHYGGYCSAAVDGAHMIGATFQRWLDHSDILVEDDDYNLEKLEGGMSGFSEGMKVFGHRASVRTTAPDHFPVIGSAAPRLRRVPFSGDVYVSTAHGSHGIISSIAGAVLLRDMILEQDVGLSDESVAALCPSRFVDGKN